MDLKPLSFRLLNDQTPVQFVLKGLVGMEGSLIVDVQVEEGGTDWLGIVQAINAKRLTELRDELTAYENYTAMSEAKRKAVPVPVLAPRVEIARHSHEEFPVMR